MPRKAPAADGDCPAGVTVTAASDSGSPGRSRDNCRFECGLLGLAPGPPALSAAPEGSTDPAQAQRPRAGPSDTMMIAAAGSHGESEVDSEHGPGSANALRGGRSQCGRAEPAARQIRRLRRPHSLQAAAAARAPTRSPWQVRGSAGRWGSESIRLGCGAAGHSRIGLRVCPALSGSDRWAPLGTP